jgi:hypothetical protein
MEFTIYTRFATANLNSMGNYLRQVWETHLRFTIFPADLPDRLIVVTRHPSPVTCHSPIANRQSSIFQ